MLLLHSYQLRGIHHLCCQLCLCILTAQAPLHHVVESPCVGTGCSVGTEQLLEYQSLVTVLVDDQISFGYALNLTDNEGMQPASRKLMAPAAPAAATPTVYALPLGQKLPYHYLAAQDLNSTTAELSPIFDISPSEEPPESPVSSPSEEPSSPEESPVESPTETPSESPPESPELSPTPEADGAEMSPSDDGDDDGDGEDNNDDDDSDIPTAESTPALSYPN